MCPLELVATPMPSPRCRLGGSLRKSGADSNGISGTFCTLARALSWAGVRVSAGVWAGAWVNSGIAQASAAHNGKVLASIWLLHDTPKQRRMGAGRRPHGFCASPKTSTFPWRGLPAWPRGIADGGRSEEHTSELQSLRHLVCRLLL